MEEIQSQPCGAPTKSTGKPCKQLVAPGMSKCRAGHAVDQRRWDGAVNSLVSKNDVSRIAPGKPFEFEDLVAPEDVSPNQIIAAEVPTDKPATVTEIDVARWARAGASNPDTVKALREYGITPDEASRRVVLSTGETVTLVTAVERGEIAAYDTPMVAATWPGEGWRYEGDQLRWVTSATPEFLAQLARESDPEAAKLRVDDSILGAQMSAELTRCAATFDGADLVVVRGPNAPNADWRAGLDDDLFSTAAKRAAVGLAAGDPTFAAYRRRWLETPTPGPATVAI